ncbi:MAG: SUMF1/EgtB/PvdO family nonheme iron enzyme [Deltaproteobacteria bacterium]|nr:SUMF1/EgtB/PvdO family nonheme iron enzyme [Deltaproteobacteria bacterium]
MRKIYLSTQAQELGLVGIAICILLTTFGASAQSVAEQLDLKAEEAGPTNPIFKPLELRKCLPAWLEVEAEETKKIREKYRAIDMIIGPRPDLKLQEMLFGLALNFYYEYQTYFLRSKQLEEKLRADPKNEKLRREIESKRAKLKLNEGKWLSKAIDVLRKIVEKYPKHKHIDEVYSLLGEVLWFSGKEKEALKILKHLIKKFPRSKFVARSYMFFGEFYLGKRNLEKAKLVFERAVRDKEPEYSACATYRIALCHQLVGDSQKSVEWFKKAISITPKGSPIRAASAKTLGFIYDMVAVPAGWFWMGCNPEVDKDCSFNEKPGRKIYLDGFWIDRTEVTIFQYGRCVKAKACSAEGLRGLPWREFGEAYGPDWCTRFKERCKNNPVTRVNWEQAQSYCKWLGKRLPTEAEWEKAARGADGRKYPWGNEEYKAGKQLANIADKQYEKRGYIHPVVRHDYDDGFSWISPVGCFPKGASPCGALDMVGNVWEWVSDWYADSHDPNASDRNPQGPATGKHRVLRRLYGVRPTSPISSFTPLDCGPGRTGSHPAPRVFERE